MERRNYFIKMPVDFFDSDEIKILTAQPGGDEMTIFYIKCLLSAARNDGYLIYNEAIPYTDTLLSRVTGCSIETVRTAVEWLRGFGLLEIQPGGIVYLPRAAEWTTSERKSTERVRRYRRRQALAAAKPKQPVIQGVAQIKKNIYD